MMSKNEIVAMFVKCRREYTISGSINQIVAETKERAERVCDAIGLPSYTKFDGTMPEKHAEAFGNVKNIIINRSAVTS